MNYTTWITLLFPCGIAALGFAVKGGVDWYVGDRTTVEGRRRRKKGMIHFFLGLLGVVIVGSIIGILLAGQDSPAGPVTTPSEPPTEGCLGKGENYVIDKLYDGGSYTGYINPETDEPQGNGVMRYTDGNKYDGEWEDGQRHGSGLMTYRNGDSYDGQWENGQRQGTGTYIWHDGGQYVGSYKNNMRDGMGDYFGWSGFVSEYGWAGNYHGLSKEDYFEGMGRFEFDNGDVFVGTFHNNEFWTGVYTYSDGKQFTITDAVPGQ